MAHDIGPAAPDTDIAPSLSVLSSMQSFIVRASVSGIMLIHVVGLALGLANSAFAGGYSAVLRADVAMTVGPIVLTHSVEQWINQGLIGIFFFLIGLEIKRELRFGPFFGTRVMALPIIAALGSAVAPVAIYLALNLYRPGAAGWGIPIASDAVVMLGVLALVGAHVPFSLKLFLTAVAIIGNVLAALALAMSSANTINLGALGAGLAIFALLLLANEWGIRSTCFYAGFGSVIGLAFIQSGVHAPLAGLLAACTIPQGKPIDSLIVLNRVCASRYRFGAGAAKPGEPRQTHAQQHAIGELRQTRQEVRAPLQKMERTLQPWVLFLILPLFVLANAGVLVSATRLDGDHLRIALGVWLGLVVGKPIGLLGATWLAVRAGVAALPPGVHWRHMLGAACLAGVGLTMSLLLSAYSFEERALVDTAKLSVLGASLASGLLGYGLLWRAPGRQTLPG